MAMLSLNHLRIGTRLGMSHTLLILLLTAMAGLAVLELTRVGDATHQLATREWVKVNAVNTIAELTQENALQTLLVLTAEPEAVKAAQVRLAANKATITAKLKLLDSLVVRAEGRQILTEVQQRRAAFVASFAQAADRHAKGQTTEARALYMHETLPALNALHERLKALSEFQHKIADETTALVQDGVRSGQRTALAFGLMGLLVGVVAAWRIALSITRPLAEATAVAQAIAQGDLTRNLTVHGKDETGQLSTALNDMLTQLRDIVGQVRLSSDSIATGSAQIASGNADLSQRTEEQAANLEETAASMEQISSTVKTNADTAGQAHQLVAEASAAAAQGGQVVGTVVATMQDIAASSRQISDIIGVIDGIAFQTNILALNAAVEAARAGEQGRGFAVVASEVRSLAQRSASAAKEIKSLIVASVDQVELGARQVHDAGTSMTHIVAQVGRVSELIGQISHASAEQSTGIGQVSDAVGQLDQVTQQNAALVEQSAAAAESLRVQATRLTEVVGVFRLAR